MKDQPAKSEYNVSMYERQLAICSLSKNDSLIHFDVIGHLLTKIATVLVQVVSTQNSIKTLSE